MSQNNKLSLWQKIKQRLTRAKDAAGTDKKDINDDIDKKAIDAHVTARDAKARDADSNEAANTDQSQSKVRRSTDDTDKRDTDKSGNNKDIEATIPSENDDDSTRSNTPIVDYLKQYFHQQQWRYTHYRPKSSDPQRSHHLSLRMKNKHISCGYLLRVQEGNQLLAVYGVLPFLIPESHQSAAMLLITQINYDMLIGNLEMDINDGEIRYKHAIDVDAVGLNDDIIEHLLQSVIAMTTVAYGIFSDLINTSNPSDDMPTLLLELRAQADARTFFLPTDFVQ